VAAGGKGASPVRAAMTWGERERERERGEGSGRGERGEKRGREMENETPTSKKKRKEKLSPSSARASFLWFFSNSHPADLGSLAGFLSP